MNPSIWTAIQPIASQAARDVLRTVGVFLAAHGYITNGSVGTEAFIGAGMTLAGLFWGWFTTSGYLQLAGLLKKLTATKTQAAAVNAAQVLPPAAAVDTAIKASSVASVTKALLVAFLLSAVLIPAAFAQTKPRVNLPFDPLKLNSAAPAPVGTATTNTLAGVNFNTIGEKLQAVVKDVIDKGIADVAAASTDAQNHNDLIAKPCWDAQEAFLKQLPAEWQTPPTAIGPALAIQISRDLLNTITGNDATSLKVACAALIGDQITIINQTLAIVGVAGITGLPAGL